MDFSWLTKAIPYLKDLSNYFLPVALTCTFILFAPDKILEQLWLLTLRKEGQPYLGVVFLFSWSVVICKIVFATIFWIRYGFNKCIAFRETIARLKDLSPEEKEILRVYIEKKSRTLELDATNYAVIGLLNSGILELAVRNPEAECAPCTIHNRVWKYINLHQDLIRHDYT